MKHLIREIIEKIERARSDIERFSLETGAILQEEREAFDKKSESLKNGDKEQAISSLEAALFSFQEIENELAEASSALKQMIAER